MCQYIQSIYQFCGCHGEIVRQRCPEPGTICGILLANPSDLLFSCYCERHSSQTFKTVRQDQRDTARIQKEYRKIIATEESDWKKGRYGSPMGVVPGARMNRDNPRIDRRIESRAQNQKGATEPRTRWNEVRRPYDGTWGAHPMRKRSFVAGKKVEKAERVQDEEIVEFAWRKTQGGRRKHDGSCAVM